VAIELYACGLRCEILIMMGGWGRGRRGKGIFRTYFLVMVSFPPRIPWSGLIDKYGVNSGGNPDHVPAKAGNYIKTGFLLPQE